LSSAFTKNLKQESSEDYINIAASIDEFIRDATGLKGTTDVKADATAMPNVPTRSRISSDLLLKNMKPKKKKKLASNEVVMDNFVTDNVDSLLLDCLEEELPTVSLELDESDVVSLVSTYQLCKSMNVCNSRWLRPSRPSLPGGGGEHPSTSSNSASGAKHHLFTSKPKRLVIYKEDLPGFKFDNDIESEKLPISKRMAKKCEVPKKEPEEDEPTESTEATTEPTTSNKSPKEDRTPKKEPKSASGKSGVVVAKKKVFVAKKTKVKVEKVDGDEDNVNDEEKNENVDENCSEASSSVSSASKKKRINKTGFPVKKKKLKEKNLKLGLKKEKGSIKKVKSEVKKEKEESTPSTPPTSANKSPKIKATKSPKVRKDIAGTPGSGGKDNGSPTAASSSKDSSPSLKQPSASKDKIKKKLGLKKRMRSSSESPKQSVRGGTSKRSTTLKSKNYSELESDSESLLEAKVPYRSPHIKAIIAKQQAEMARDKRQKNKAKK